MQNKKGNAAVVAIIIVIVAITASVITWMVATKTSEPPQQPVTTQSTAPVPVVKQSTTYTEETHPLIYRNDEYGFQLLMPSYYKGYKVLIKTRADDSLGDGVIAYISLDLPTKDKEFPADTDPKTGKSLEGYANLFTITVRSAKEYNGVLARCKKNPNPDCPVEFFGREPLGRNDQYVFDEIMSQAFPEDWDNTSKVGSKFELIN